MADEKRGVGQPKKIPDADTLAEWFELYKAWNENNPIEKMDFKGKDADQVTYKLKRPLTWVGFKVWLKKNKNVGGSTLDDYKTNKDDVYAAYSGILRDIGDEIYQDQYDGAAVGTFNQSIVARKLGLAEKTENKHDVTVKETRIGFIDKND